MPLPNRRPKFFVITALALLVCLSGFAKSTASVKTHAAQGSVAEPAAAKKRIRRMQHSRPVVRNGKPKLVRAAYTRKSTSLRRSRRGYYERFTASPYDDQNVSGDIAAGEDPVVRAAAIEALGNMNGTVLAIEPTTGRILAMVNQKLALSEGSEPCSTIKLSVALAALSEGIVHKDTRVAIGGRSRIDLTHALAMSNNAYFEALGRKLGFEKVKYYANQFGLGELAGYNIEGEHLGVYPDEELDAKAGGVGRMCSYGESISMTPLQLGAMVSAISNGGTLYYLQHPTTAAEMLSFQPKIKRTLDIAGYIPELSDGILGAVEYGTARSLRTNFSEEQILGKTGTCSNNGTRYGWFASYANTSFGRIVTVVFLRGNHAVSGPRAAELTGHFYRNLYDHSFFAVKMPMEKSATAVGAPQ